MKKKLRAGSDEYEVCDSQNQNAPISDQTEKIESYWKDLVNYIGAKLQNIFKCLS